MKKLFLLCSVAILTLSPQDSNAQFFKQLGRSIRSSYNSYNSRTQSSYNQSSQSSYNQNNASTQNTTSEEQTTQNEEGTDFRSLAVSEKEWFPTNPAINMTEEERAAKYAEMKANDSFELVDGYFVKIHRVLPNLFTFDYEQKVPRNPSYANTGDLKFTALDGTVLVLEWDNSGTNPGQRHQLLKNLYNGKFGGVWEALRDIPSDCDYLDFNKACAYKDGTAKILSPNVDYIKLKRKDYNSKFIVIDGKVSNKDKKGDYTIYSPYNDAYYPAMIRKTLSDCTVEMEGDYDTYQFGKVKVYYPNGDFFEGYVNAKGEKMLNDTPYSNFNNAVVMTALITKADSLQDLGGLYHGKLIDKKNNVKIYTKGEYDEIESITYTQRTQAEEKAKKEKAAQAIKQKQMLINKYGKKYVDIALRTDVKISDVLIVGLPIELLIELANAGKTSLEFKKSIVTPNKICYDVYNYNWVTHENSLRGFVWTDKYKITSVSLY